MDPAVWVTNSGTTLAPTQVHHLPPSPPLPSVGSRCLLAGLHWKIFQPSSSTPFPFCPSEGFAPTGANIVWKCISEITRWSLVNYIKCMSTMSMCSCKNQVFPSFFCPTRPMMLCLRCTKYKLMSSFVQRHTPQKSPRHYVTVVGDADVLFRGYFSDLFTGKARSRLKRGQDGGTGWTVPLCGCSRETMEIF